MKRFYFHVRFSWSRWLLGVIFSRVNIMFPLDVVPSLTIFFFCWSFNFAYVWSLYDPNPIRETGGAKVCRDFKPV